MLTEEEGAVGLHPLPQHLSGKMDGSRQNQAEISPEKERVRPQAIKKVPLLVGRGNKGCLVAAGLSAGADLGVAGLRLQTQRVLPLPPVPWEAPELP